VMKSLSRKLDYTDLDLHLQPELAQHPDLHDGWTAIRARRIEPVETELALPVHASRREHQAKPKQRLTANTADAVITCVDEARLRALLLEGAERLGVSPRLIQRLRAELEAATQVCATEIADDVVTMNSHIVYEDKHTGQRERVQLVYPVQAHTPNQLSVLDTLGTALLGLQVDQSLDWPLDGRIAQLKVLAVPYQPEAAGHYHL